MDRARAALARHLGLPYAALGRARRLPDAEGRDLPATSRRRVHRWGGFRIAEACDPHEGLHADQATDLAAEALLLRRKALRGASVCEIGCGTAVLSVLALRLGARRALAIDCHGPARALARATAKANGAALEVRDGDLLAGVKQRFDILIANLPQKPVAPGRRLPLGQDGGADGGRILRRFLRQAPRRLASGGSLFLFLHTLSPVGILKGLPRGWRAEVVCLRVRHVRPGEYPSALVARWDRLAARGKAVLHPRRGRPGGRTFYAAQAAVSRLDPSLRG